MKYVAGMGSGAMIYKLSFRKAGSGIQKLIRKTHRHRQHGDPVSLLSFFQTKKNRLKQ
jgi:hypothetical protein